MFGFLNIRLTDVLDVLLVGLLIFYVFRLLRGSQITSVLVTIVVLYAGRIVFSALDMKLISGILSMVLDVGVLALIVLFQPEVRRFLTNLGNTYRRAGKWLPKFLLDPEDSKDSETINEIAKATEIMGSEKCGALMVIKRKVSLDYICRTGDLIDAKISERLLRNLFFKNSPLHDGAVILDGDRVVAARCTLPITERDVPPSFGMRHKAAIGISEVTDAIVIVVSEETGHIGIVRDGKWVIVENINDLKRVLRNG